MNHCTWNKTIATADWCLKHCEAATCTFVWLVPRLLVAAFGSIIVLSPDFPSCMKVHLGTVVYAARQLRGVALQHSAIYPWPMWVQTAHNHLAAAELGPGTQLLPSMTSPTHAYYSSVCALYQCPWSSFGCYNCQWSPLELMHLALVLVQTHPCQPY